MRLPTKTKAQLGLITAVLFLMFFFVLFQLARHPETVALLTALPNPSVLACDIRCLGLTPFLQVLGETGRGLILMIMSFSFLFAAVRTGSRVSRTRAFLDNVHRREALVSNVPRPPFLDGVTIFQDERPMAFTGGLLRPQIFISTKLLETLGEEELRAVVLHESHHRKSRDPLKGVAVSFVSDFLFFLPVNRFLKKSYLLESETAADARSIELRGDPMSLVGLLLKVRDLNGLQASWFGKRTMIFPPFKKVILTVVLLAITTFIVLVPLKKNLVSMFVNHDQVCVLRQEHK
jgi:hypothetical protein